MKGESVAVLDLGTSKVVAVVAHLDERGAMVVEAAATTPCKGLYRGSVSDLAETSRAVEAVTRRLEPALGERPLSYVVANGSSHLEAVIGQGMKVMVPRTRPVATQDVLEVVNHSRSRILPAEREQLQALPRSFSLDTQRDIPDPIGMAGARLEVSTLIVSAETAALQTVERVLELAGLRCEQMVYSGLGAGISLLEPSELEDGALVLDIGAGVTTASVFAGGSIQNFAVIPVGGNLVTSDVSKLLKTTAEEAERLKKEFGSAVAEGIPASDRVQVTQIGQTQMRPMQRRVLAEIIESRMRELFILVGRALPHTPDRLVLTGGGAQLAQVALLAERVFETETVRVSEPKLSLREPLGPGMAASVGVARYVLQCGEDLIPTEGGNTLRTRVRTFLSGLAIPKAGRTRGP